MIKTKALLAAAFALAAFPVSAADWHLAETEHFKVYSDDNAENVEAFAGELELLNLAMMIETRTKKTELPKSSKVTVYRFGETSDIAALIGPGSNVAGFFIPRAGNSAAFVPVRDDNVRGLGARKSVFQLNADRVLFHEYAHYFMFQHGAAAYPPWYVEGLAELFGTLDIDPQGYVLGNAPTHRGYELSEFDIKLRSLLDPPKKRTAEDVYRTYAIGWLLTSHLTFDPKRKGQLGQYLRLFNSGLTPLAAAEQAFGDLDVLEKELDKYRRSPARLATVKFTAAQLPSVKVRPLTADESARMMMMIQSKRGVDEEKAKKQVPEARSLAARFPDSAPVLLAATEVEFDAGNLDQAEALARRALELDPRGVDAAIYLAMISMKRAETDPAQYLEARKRFIAANRIETDNPVPLTGYYLSYALAGEEAPDDAKASLEGAFSHAPFDETIRRTTAHMLLLDGRENDAKVVLGPLINSAHSSRQGAKLRDLLAKFDAGDRQPLIDRLRPRTDSEAKKEAEAEAEEEKRKKKDGEDGA